MLGLPRSWLFKLPPHHIYCDLALKGQLACYLAKRRFVPEGFTHLHLQVEFCSKEQIRPGPAWDRGNLRSKSPDDLKRQSNRAPEKIPRTQSQSQDNGTLPAPEVESWAWFLLTFPIS